MVGRIHKKTGTRPLQAGTGWLVNYIYITTY